MQRDGMGAGSTHTHTHTHTFTQAGQEGVSCSAASSSGSMPRATVAQTLTGKKKGPMIGEKQSRGGNHAWKHAAAVREHSAGMGMH